MSTPLIRSLCNSNKLVRGRFTNSILNSYLSSRFKFLTRKLVDRPDRGKTHFVSDGLGSEHCRVISGKSDWVQKSTCAKTRWSSLGWAQEGDVGTSGVRRESTWSVTTLWHFSKRLPVCGSSWSRYTVARRSTREWPVDEGRSVYVLTW